jgi:hypothetical protein
MSLPQFELELRRIARFHKSSPAALGLGEAVEKIKANPTLAESRLLARVLRALAFRSGEFRRAEMSGFDSTTLPIVVALMNAARDGANTRDEWMEAVELAEAAAAIR